jgi:3-hydroxybutyryl-CoA dehydrogenase
MAEFERVAVVGCGTMGSGIAQVAARAGCRVTVVEADQGRLDAGLSAMRTFLDGSVARNKLTGDERAAVLARVHASTSIAEIADAQLIIEAVTENRHVKHTLLSGIGAIAHPDAVVVTNTSALSVSDLATASPRPEQFAGLHFFNPVPLMNVVEVVAALQTSPQVTDRLAAFVTDLGKEPIAVKDRPGFLVNRLLLPYLNDVIQAYDDGLASAEDLDTALRLGLGYKQGPLELLDMIGLDVHQHATGSAYDALRDPAYAPPPLLAAMVAAGRLGNKNGKGFRSMERNA